MTVQVVVTGIGLKSALGTVQTSWKKLLLGQSGIQYYQPFPEQKSRPLALINQQPTHLTELTQTILIDTLEDANLTPPLPHCGVVIGSSRGYQAQWEEFATQHYNKQYNQQKSINSSVPIPDFFHHMAAMNTAHFIGSNGPVLAPMAACATGLWTIAQAYELIQMGYCEQVIVGAVETPITPLTLAGFEKMGALALTGAYPFDRYREGFVLGEGGAMFVLESMESAKHRSAQIYGQILGFGLTADASSSNRPDLEGKSAITAIKNCLSRSHLFPQDIDYIHAHGTATLLNDQHEANLINTIFPDGVAVSSTKGATGHTLGASGALGIAFCLMALQQQILPPCVGLKEPEFEINLVREARKASIKNVLCLSFGFGGQNGAIALGKPRISRDIV
ncbi:beta-ketoacyl-ACP synthase [Limnoraphis robusta]|uniref:Beta-ketoacyl-ACP synthase n=1 Tax=Limnoraphis robusta CCNP1315 TaxID=3110306 RepID=A0ABU5TVZ3_9CYAN|nr:beta-ketoacyl-ACP synthase [Limnoraphis robusta]MEA5519070.1 beta-ketoacyl-ACP synthase [Limnoraphis robusta CCNP1315]MEA5544332.1 beta-ketoacyl-ACP synthase [Limnoraphis robusta CCNP1324]